MNRSIESRLNQLDVSHLSAAEVSGGSQRDRGWRQYASLFYPQFDLCDAKPAPGQYDVVICEQVIEHVRDPSAALRKLADMLTPGGLLVVDTPFLIRVHPAPEDYWRFTASGLRLLIESVGLSVEEVHTWGNRHAVRRNFRNWAWHLPWDSLHNDPFVPVVVWAFARAPRPDNSDSAQMRESAIAGHTPPSDGP